jgi:muconolactone D-isomerase
MEFLVEIEVQFPSHFSDEQRLGLIALERARGEELCSEGILRAIWRVPGQLANYAVWSAPNATEVHQAITSLPLWPYAKVRVTALAAHDLAAHCLGIPMALIVPE